jgi:hypothetical protein
MPDPNRPRLAREDVTPEHGHRLIVQCDRPGCYHTILMAPPVRGQAKLAGLGAILPLPLPVRTPRGQADLYPPLDRTQRACLRDRHLALVLMTLQS